MATDLEEKDGIRETMARYCFYTDSGRDSLAVVDERLRVHGVDGLRVMDCSVMPTQVSGNTNGPVIAMARRAAELILDPDHLPRLTS